MKISIKDIKQIPKYMIAKIKKVDLITNKDQTAQRRFYAYLACWKKQLVKVTVAVRTKYKRWQCKQVAVHFLNSKTSYVKDLIFYHIGGYQVGWYDLGLDKTEKFYEDGQWYENNTKLFDPYAPVINLNFLDRFPEFQYSEYKKVHAKDILSYLRLYREFPETEYLLKSGLGCYALCKTILSQMRKDKSFHKWLVAHKDYYMSNGYYYCDVLLKAYKKNLNLQALQEFEERKKDLIYDYHGKDIVKLVIKKGVLGEYEKLFKYLDKRNLSQSLYLDYVRACDYLNLDLTDDSIRYPSDFHHWHDIRLQQYKTVREEELRKENALRARERRKREKERKLQEEQHAKDFLIAARKYLPLAGFTEDEHYAIFLAQSKTELINEGNALSHCVGYNGYDRKMAREETLIFFVRKLEDLETPFVTIEYSLKTKEVLQCYAYKNSTPDDNVLEFVNNKWLPHANQELARIAA